ncbi:MAG: SGNH/GDSL hydrolase family protein [Candidatus Krumholzibacteriia bacterium]
MFILLLELLLGTTHMFGARKSWSEPDPILGWRFTPNRGYWYHRENDHPITGRINRFGWRDRDRSLSKPPGVFRVAVIGDSFVEAIQVEQDSTFTALVEDRLNRGAGRRAEILNFGRSGMTQTEELLVLEHEVAGYAPDLVVLLFVPVNDVSEVTVETSDSALRPFFDLSANGDLSLNTSFVNSGEYKLKAAINRFKQHSLTVSFLNERYNLLRRSRRRARIEARGRSSGRIDGALSLCTASAEETYARNYRLNKRLIEEMAGYCRRQGMAFMLVCADWVYKTEDAARYSAIDPTFDAGYFARDLRQFSDSLRIDYLDLQEPFQLYYRRRGIPLHWQHWNYAGHRLVAEELAAKLESIMARD